MLGYLFAGVLVGPLGLGAVAPSDGPHFLAELGLILLMFMVGLDFSWAEIWAARRAVFFAGTLQVALSMTCAALVAHAFDMPWPAAVLAGGAAAMCSTGIALKQLQEQREFARTHGRIATGILLFQDLATLPFLVVIDSGSAAGSIVFVTAVKQLMVATLSLGGCCGSGVRYWRIALEWIRQRQSVDLFLLVALLLALGAAYLAKQLWRRAYDRGVSGWGCSRRKRPQPSRRGAASTFPRYVARAVLRHGRYADRSENRGGIPAADPPVACAVRSRQAGADVRRHASGWLRQNERRRAGAVLAHAAN